jgi:hypothetical protein
MANYEATTRSNYFRVKNRTAFKKWCSKRGLEFWTKDDKKPGPFAISGNDGYWPSSDPETGDEIDIMTELAHHLDPRDIAIFFEVGYEKLRYLVGCATAVHPDGRSVSVNLNDIYERAKAEFGSQMSISEAEY